MSLFLVLAILRTDDEVSAPLSPPSRPTHAASAVESISPLVHSERSATVVNVRNIAEGHAGEGVNSHDWLRSPLCGKRTATVLFSAPTSPSRPLMAHLYKKRGLVDATAV